MAKILITGGAGFIGSALVRDLASRGNDLTVIDKLSYSGDLARLQDFMTKIRFHQIDLADAAAVDPLLQSERPQVIVHLAAETHVDRSILHPGPFVLSNVLGTANLLQAAVRANVTRFVQISTDEVYGSLLAKSTRGFEEADPLLPNSPYAASKASADHLVRAFHHTYGLPALIVRPSNNYGPWQHPEKLIPLTVAKALRHERVPLYGTGENRRTWLFVEDGVQAIVRVMESGREGEIYNVGSGEEHDNLEVVHAILDFLNKDRALVRHVADRPAHDYRYVVDTAKIEKEIGWAPRMPFMTGLEQTVRWCVENQDWLFEKLSEVEDYPGHFSLGNIQPVKKAF